MITDTFTTSFINCFVFSYNFADHFGLFWSFFGYQCRERNFFGSNTSRCTGGGAIGNRRPRQPPSVSTMCSCYTCARGTRDRVPQRIVSGTGEGGKGREGDVAEEELIYRKKSAGNISWLSQCPYFPAADSDAHYQFVRVLALCFPGDAIGCVPLVRARPLSGGVFTRDPHPLLIAENARVRPKSLVVLVRNFSTADSGSPNTYTGSNVQNAPKSSGRGVTRRSLLPGRVPFSSFNKTVRRYFHSWKM